MKVSYIVPVYKVEQYLSQCVESLLAQTYTDFEILLVDDGSPDGCPALCDQWAERDSRIRSLHKKNGGLSDARNYGLQNAKGDYVVFIDGDDFWVDKESLEQLIGVVKSHQDCDFIGYNCSYYYPSKNSFRPWVEYDTLLSDSTNGSDALVALVKSGTFPMSACLKILKRDFLIKNDLFFEKGQISEDIPWFINLLEKCDKCCFVNQYIYAYRQNVAGSITNSSGERSFRSLLNIVETEVAKIDERCFSKNAKDALYSFLAYEVCILMTYKGISRADKLILSSYKWLFEYDANPKVRMIKKAKRWFGLPVTICLLKLYNAYRRHKH